MAGRKKDALARIQEMLGSIQPVPSGPAPERTDPPASEPAAKASESASGSASEPAAKASESASGPASVPETPEKKDAQPEPKPEPKPKPSPTPAREPIPLRRETTINPVDNRLTELERVVADLKDLRELSEALSVRYNPFLAFEEDLSDRHDPAVLLDHQLRQNGSRQATGLVQPPAPPAHARDPHAFAPHAAPAPPSKPPAYPAPPLRAPPPERSHAVPYTFDESVHEPTVEGPVTSFSNSEASVGESRQESTLYKGRGSGGGAREAFLAMHWFKYLSVGTDPSIIFVYLDYYHFVGWLDDASHGWLLRLAEGVATRKRDAQWSDYGMDVERLAHNHLRNLRFLDKLFGTTLQHGEAQYLQQTVDMLLMEDD